MMTYTGTTYLQQMLRSRRDRNAVKAELNVSMQAIDDFANGRGTLPPAKLQALATFLTGGHGEYVPELDLMRSVNRAEPRSMGIHPPRYVSPKVGYQAGTMMAPGPQPVKPEKPKVELHRPGWAR